MIPSQRPLVTIRCPNCKKTLVYIPSELTVGDKFKDICWCGSKIRAEVTEYGLKLLEESK